MITYVRCSKCGSQVSNRVTTDLVVMGYVECVDCIKGGEMNTKIGDTVEHGGEKFTVVDIKHHQTIDGKVLYLTAYDPDLANKMQQDQIKAKQTGENFLDMLRKLSEGGKGFDLGGFHLGG